MDGVRFQVTCNSRFFLVRELTTILIWLANSLDAIHVPYNHGKNLIKKAQIVIWAFQIVTKSNA